MSWPFPGKRPKILCPSPESEFLCSGTRKIIEYFQKSHLVLFREKKLDFWMFFQWPWRSLQVMLQTGASHKTACYRNGYIKIKWEKLPFYTRKIMISMSGNQNCMSWFSYMVCILVKHNIEASLHDRGGLFFCDPPSFPVIFLHNPPFWRAQKTVTLPLFHPLPPANFWQVPFCVF